MQTASFKKAEGIFKWLQATEREQFKQSPPALLSSETWEEWFSLAPLDYIWDICPRLADMTQAAKTIHIPVDQQQEVRQGTQMSINAYIQATNTVKQSNKWSLLQSKIKQVSTHRSKQYCII